MYNRITCISLYKISCKILFFFIQDLGFLITVFTFSLYRVIPNSWYKLHRLIEDTVAIIYYIEMYECKWCVESWIKKKTPKECLLPMLISAIFSSKNLKLCKAAITHASQLWCNDWHTDSKMWTISCTYVAATK